MDKGVLQMKVRLWIIAVLCILCLWMNGSLTDQAEASDTITSDASVLTHAYDANTSVTKEFHIFYLLYILYKNRTKTPVEYSVIHFAVVDNIQIIRNIIVIIIKN